MAATAGPQSERTSYTQAELVAELIARFGADHQAWAFACPRCGDVATYADWAAALAALPEADTGHPRTPEVYMGQACIGRLPGQVGRGCDWAVFGLLTLPGTLTVTLPEGRTARSFPIADAPRKEEE